MTKTSDRPPFDGRSAESRDAFAREESCPHDVDGSERIESTPETTEYDGLVSGGGPGFVTTITLTGPDGEVLETITHRRIPPLPEGLDQ